MPQMNFVCRNIHSDNTWKNPKYIYMAHCLNTFRVIEIFKKLFFIENTVQRYRNKLCR